MGIPLSSSFTRNSAQPLDDLATVADITARNAILAGRRYEGMATYVTSEATNYQLIGGITNSDWAEFSGSGGTGGTGTTTAKAMLVNNSVNTINEIGEYLADCPGLIIEYYLVRRTDSGVRTMSGAIRLETYPDEALSIDRWKILELNRSENGDPSGVAFTLTEVDTEKSVLVATLDDMTGASHSCKFYYKITEFSNSTGKVIILDNNSINPISAIGEYLVDAGAIIIDYFIYRKTGASFKSMSGKIILEGNPDASTNPLKWELLELERSESEASGVTFSLDDVGTEKSILVITLDNMAGSDHRCDFYYNKTVLAN